MTARHACLVLFSALACAVFACGDDDDPMTPEPPWALEVPTPPENLLENLVTIYNDDEHTALERVNAYDSLLLRPDASTNPPRTGFKFILQPADIQHGLPASWGLDAEMEAHRGLFEAQADTSIYLLELRITHGATERIANDPEKVDWEAIFASNVYLRLMFNPNDGLEVNGAQANFEFAPDTAQPPAEGGRYYGRYWIGEWTDLPRPAPRGASVVEPATWGGIKAIFLP